MATHNSIMILLLLLASASSTIIDWLGGIQFVPPPLPGPIIVVKPHPTPAPCNECPLSKEVNRHNQISKTYFLTNFVLRLWTAMQGFGSSHLPIAVHVMKQIAPVGLKETKESSEELKSR